MSLNRLEIEKEDKKYVLMASIDECLDDLKTEYIPKDDHIKDYLEKLSYSKCKSMVKFMILNDIKDYILYEFKEYGKDQYNCLAIRDYGHGAYCLTFAMIEGAMVNLR